MSGTGDSLCSLQFLRLGGMGGHRGMLRCSHKWVFMVGSCEKSGCGFFTDCLGRCWSVFFIVIVLLYLKRFL
jgi:hypothetical protein